MNSIFHLPLDKEVKTNNQQTPQDIKNKKASRKQFTSIYMDLALGDVLWMVSQTL